MERPGDLSEAEAPPGAALDAAVRGALADVRSVRRVPGGALVGVALSDGSVCTLTVRTRAAHPDGLLLGDRMSYGYRSTHPPPSDRLGEVRAALAALARYDHDWPRLLRSAPAPRPATRSSFVYATDDELARLSTDEAVGRWLDARAPAGEPVELHLFLLAAPCDQACAFCELAEQMRSPVRRSLAAAVRRLPLARRGWVEAGGFDALLRALSAREARLTIMGADWARHPARDLLLQRLEREHRVRVSLLGPSTALADGALAARVAALPTLERVILTLLSVDLAAHDAVTRTPGSGARALGAIERLVAAGHRPQVNVVLVPEVLATLPATLAWVDARGLRAALLAFVPDAGPAGWPPDGLVAPVDAVRGALERSGDALGCVAELSSVPLCAWPRGVELPSLSTTTSPTREPPVWGRVCDGCVERPRCPGVTGPYARAYGERGLRAFGPEWGDDGR